MSSTNITISTEDAQAFRKKMLAWYDKHRRVLPWRALPQETADPYKVWLSEIMLQQTTVQAVIKYFVKFTEKWPDIHALANAETDDIMSNWAGLGYYARARNLHKCAQIISRDYDGAFPREETELKKLPGIGDYTSAAIRSIAFDKPATVVDGNVERVMARYHACKIANPEGKKHLKEYARAYSQDFKDRPSDYAQSLMDLGATICTPKSPACSLCPIIKGCAAREEELQTIYPIKAPKKERPKKYGYVYYITNNKDEVLIERRPDKGLLGGMYGLPTSEWVNKEAQLNHLLISPFVNATDNHHHVDHVFTHFSLKLKIYHLKLNEKSSCKGFKWLEKSQLDDVGIPTLFQKVLNSFQ